MASNQTAAQQFFEGQACLIVEPSKAFLTSIQSCIKGLGLTSTEIYVAGKYEEAIRIIEKVKPRILITECDVDGSNGLSLITQQLQSYSGSSSLAILIGRNGSGSAAVETAEGDVDGFLLKPFSVDEFKKKLLSVIESKLSPSEYMKKIGEGRSLLKEQKYQYAIEVFQEAKKLNDKPSLACFFAGDSFRRLNEIQGALSEFREGRKYQPLHYRCLIGEFEILMANKNYKEAYDLIPLIVKNFPLTSELLTQVFIATVLSRQFESLLSYYEYFTKVEHRTPELIRVASMSLFTGGKWCLQKKDISLACEFFEKNLKVGGRNIAVLEQIVNELMKADATHEAQTFFAHADPSDVGTPRHNALSFEIDLKILPKPQLLEKARKFALSGEASSENYKVIVQMFACEGKTTFAESIIQKAAAMDPEIRQTLYQILEDCKSKAGLV